MDAPHIIGLKVLANLQFVVFSRILFRASSMENAEDVGGRITRSVSTLWRHWTGPEALDESQLALATSTLHISVGVWLLFLFTFAAPYTPKTIFPSFQTSFVKLQPPAQGLMVAVVDRLPSPVAVTAVVPSHTCQLRT